MKSPPLSIDATLTFSPGNEALLLYLLEQLDQRNIKTTVYIRHKRALKSVSEKHLSNVVARSTNVFGMLKRMTQKNGRFFFFCSIPPIVFQANSVVYFHNLDIIGEINWKEQRRSFKTKIKHWSMVKLIQYLHGQCRTFICQSAAVADRLNLSYPNIRVKVIPFYEPIGDVLSYDQIPGLGSNVRFDFSYPATADVHKNHFRLFDAIGIAGVKEKISVCVTIPYDAHDYIHRISEVNKKLGYEAIINFGRVTRADSLQLISQSKALIFPSLKETLGLPLLEAAELNKPIIVSDLAYAHAVVENIITFDPLNVEEIADLLTKVARQGQSLPVARLRVPNDVEALLAEICC